MVWIIITLNNKMYLINYLHSCYELYTQLSSNNNLLNGYLENKYIYKCMFIWKYIVDSFLKHSVYALAKPSSSNFSLLRFYDEWKL